MFRSNPYKNSDWGAWFFAIAYIVAIILIARWAVGA